MSVDIQGRLIDKNGNAVRNNSGDTKG